MSEFDAEKYWSDKESKVWVVLIGERRGSGRTDKKIVRARTPEGAIRTGKYHCFLRGKLSARARLATPTDLGATRVNNHG